MLPPPVLLSLGIRIGFRTQIRVRNLIRGQFTNLFYFLISHTRLNPHSDPQIALKTTRIPQDKRWVSLENLKNTKLRYGYARYFSMEKKSVWICSFCLKSMVLFTSLMVCVRVCVEDSRMDRWEQRRRWWSENLHLWWYGERLEKKDGYKRAVGEGGFSLRENQNHVPLLLFPMGCS